MIESTIQERARRIVASHLRHEADTKRRARIELLDELAAEWEREAAYAWEIGSSDYAIYRDFSQRMTDRARRELAEGTES